MEIIRRHRGERNVMALIPMFDDDREGAVRQEDPHPSSAAAPNSSRRAYLLALLFSSSWPPSSSPSATSPTDSPPLPAAAARGDRPSPPVRPTLASPERPATAATLTSFRVAALTSLTRGGSARGLSISVGTTHPGFSYENNDCGASTSFRAAASTSPPWPPTGCPRPLQLHREDMVQSGLLPIRVWRNRCTDVHGPGGGVAGVGAAEEGNTF
ncbi:hypothetical protein Taro_040311 [Colocasia esculenta]|uniref:Uncharacterized protein n=1 Tax=Colocasia esculenta TaxID=4460 RepID=A0A843WBJ3_COLES|nr:hypothetical protein [Colocasia esculenta]